MIEAAVVLLLVACVGGGFAWGHLQDAAARRDAERLKELETLKAKAKAREAEIFSLPAGDKRDVIDRL